jgi:hypothetical protein
LRSREPSKKWRVWRATGFAAASGKKEKSSSHSGERNPAGSRP